MKHLIDVALDIAMEQIGVPYVKSNNDRNSANNHEGFDCSGLVQYCLLESGILIPEIPGRGIIRFSEEFYDFFGIHIHARAAKRGDLVFFSSKGVIPTHVAFYLGLVENVESILHTNSKLGKVSISPLEESCREVRYDPRLGDQLYFDNPIGFKRPSVALGGRFQGL